jgi:hypothetical protein
MVARGCRLVITLQILNQMVSLGFVTVLFGMMPHPAEHAVAWGMCGRARDRRAVHRRQTLIGCIWKAGVTSWVRRGGSVVVSVVWVFYSARSSCWRGIHLAVRAQPRITVGESAAVDSESPFAASPNQNLRPGRRALETPPR